MHVLEAGVDPERFFERVRSAPARALLLDYDGTLSPFRIDRAEAAPYPQVIDPLNRILRETDTRVALISGRAIVDLAPLVRELQPRPELWGSHGWERLDAAGRHHPAALPTEIAELLDAARQRAERGGFLALCEVKPPSIALHWRGQPPEQQQTLKDRAQEAWGPLAARAAGQMDLHEFDGGLEFRATGRNKGDAALDIVKDLKADAAIAYAGDDRTDEDAFRVLRPRGLCILVRDRLRPTAAHVWLRPPDELVDFLTRWRQSCTSKP